MLGPRPIGEAIISRSIICVARNAVGRNSEDDDKEEAAIFSQTVWLKEDQRAR